MVTPELKQKFNRQILHNEYIKPCGTFSAFYKAEALLKGMGYRTGSMEGGNPIGFAPADPYDYISKWTNMDKEDRSLLHGVMLPDPEFREGGVVIVFFESPLSEVPQTED